MSSSTDGPTVVRVSQKGQATIPKDLRERFGIDAPGEVFIYEEGGRIVVEPVPSLDGYTHVIVTGSEASIVRHKPWYDPGIAVIRAARQRRVPVLGSCSPAWMPWRSSSDGTGSTTMRPASS